MAIGADAEISIRDLKAPKLDYVALGHIHYHQCLSDSPPVVYAGSLDRVDFSEEHDDKGFIYIELDDGETRWDFVEVDARPFVTIEVNCLKAKSPVDKIISKINSTDVEGAVVRIIAHISDRMRGSIGQKRIDKALKDAGVYWVHSIAMKVQRSDVPRLDIDNVMEASHSDILEAYFDSVDPPIPTRDVDMLMKLAERIMADVNDSI